jgi:hypothetical protein
LNPDDLRHDVEAVAMMPVAIWRPGIALRQESVGWNIGYE